MKTKIGLIAGSFDIIHPGYVRMFKEAKDNACHHLIVALQDDPTIDRPQKIKPIHTWEEREEILLAIKYVDEIVKYNTEDELFNLLKTLKYDIRILGSDYLEKDYTGKQLEKETYFCNRNHEYSLTSLKFAIYKSLKERY